MSVPRVIALLVNVFLLTSCASEPPWQPPAGHQNVAVVSALDPSAVAYLNRQSDALKGFEPSSIDVDINKSVISAIHTALVSSNHYTLADSPVDLQTFKSAKYIQVRSLPWRSFTLDTPLADYLVSNTQGKAVDLIIAVTDVRYQDAGCATGVCGAISLAGTVVDALIRPDPGWGVHYALDEACHWVPTAYLTYNVFIIDAHTGATVASSWDTVDRKISDADLGQKGYSALSGSRRVEIAAEINTEIAGIVRDDIPKILSGLNLVPDGHLSPGYHNTACTTH
jgi:hypothetical protein